MWSYAEVKVIRSHRIHRNDIFCSLLEQVDDLEVQVRRNLTALSGHGTDESTPLLVVVGGTYDGEVGVLEECVLFLVLVFRVHDGKPATVS